MLFLYSETRQRGAATLRINSSGWRHFLKGLYIKGKLNIMAIDNTLAIKKKPKRQIPEFIDSDREVADKYYEILDSNVSPKKMLEKMYQLIAKDKDFYDPYLIAYKILFAQGNNKEAAQLLSEAYDRAIDRITDVHGNWPKEMLWGFLENRHLMRTIESYAYFCWEAGKTDVALDIFRRLFRTNPNDNQGTRHSILALRLGLGSQEWQKPFEVMRDGSVLGLEAVKLTEWFETNAKRFPEEFQWFFDFHEK